VRDSLSAALLEPGFRLGNCLALLLTLWLVVDGSVRNRAGDGVEKALKHADRGGHLVRGKVLDQSVSMLFVCCHDKLFYTATVHLCILLPSHCPRFPAYDKPMAKAKKFELESPPILDEEDEETLAAIDEGIRDAKAGRNTVPAEEREN